MDKILRIQSEIGAIVKTEDNPYYKSKYVDVNGVLEQLIPLLEKHKVTVMQPLANMEGKPALQTIVWDAENGKEIIQGTIPLPTTIFEKGKDKEPVERPLTSQEFGSAITYFRRYALQSIFLLRSEDDDANLSSNKKSKQSVVDSDDQPF